MIDLSPMGDVRSIPSGDGIGRWRRAAAQP
jgi:hypothetical protein